MRTKWSDEDFPVNRLGAIDIRPGQIVRCSWNPEYYSWNIPQFIFIFYFIHCTLDATNLKDLDFGFLKMHGFLFFRQKKIQLKNTLEKT